MDQLCVPNRLKAIKGLVLVSHSPDFTIKKSNSV